MENQNIVIVKHHPRPLKLSNPFYTMQCPDIEDRIVINLTSRNPDKAFARQVSPFYVGPLQGPDGACCDSLEVYWQIGKVFEHHDNNGQPNEAYFAYREKMSENTTEIIADAAFKGKAVKLHLTAERE